MTVGAALPDDLSGLMPKVRPTDRLRPSISVTGKIGEVETIWRAFEASGLESPGQSFAFIRQWTERMEVPTDNQLYVIAELGGAPVALLPLLRRSRGGVQLLSWFPGDHVGCNAPLVDASRLAPLQPEERQTLWSDMLRGIKGADLCYLKSVPQRLAKGVDLFAELGIAVESDVLYRATFSSWEDANTTQRNKSRRKHDRQQGEKLEALGEVTFAEIGPGEEARQVLDEMFRQRAIRFRQMGVADPFVVNGVRRFYDATVAPNSWVKVRLHVMRLNGTIVAVRYNVLQGSTLFCLISSMSEDPAIQVGSPGKQCLLRVMQSVFDRGITTFDMGSGLTDEKRHWCNIQTPLRHHYLPLTPKGAAAAMAHRNWQTMRHRIKTSPALLKVAKSARSAMMKLKGRTED